jgi:SynChlorMet cassette radical SAM/SPASM protein ScmE
LTDASDNVKVMTTPRSIDLAVTGKCNLRCTYCSHFTSAADVESDLPLSEWLLFFEELKRLAVMTLTLSGGEPFCRSDLPVLIEGIVRNRMRFSILSNGTLVTDRMASFLADTGRCDGVQISIDGSSPGSHDAFRGSGNFNRAVEGIRTLQKHGVPVSVRVTIHKHNFHDIRGIASLLLDDLRLPQISTNAASYMGLCRKNSEMICLDIEERTAAMEMLLQLEAEYPGRIEAAAGPLFEARDWLELEKASRAQNHTDTGTGFLCGCSGPMSRLAVRADGVLVPCSQLSHIELGRINQVDLKTVWQDNPELKRLRERFYIPLTRFAFCRECPYINHCTGGCPALSYTMTGDVYQPSPDCLRDFLKKGGRLPAL